MKKLQLIRSTMMPLPMSNVDTDQIMPKEFLKRVERSGYGEYLFYDWKKDADGNLDPAFPLNSETYKNAKVLVTGSNFGTGSSREHAPWGLQDWGFDAIISTNFADIFKNNCLNIGLLPIEVNADVVEKLFKLIQEDPKTTIEISVENNSFKCSQISANFVLDDFSKQKLIKGQDQIDITLEHQRLITNFSTDRKKLIPNLD
ncbi:MAG: 3-isopropylmalate dehydratase small subunit [Candidatus Actinomarinales bacterium]|nr:MAG: 3-isopropylmalate dehydratase small subunit [Candidatus Actinomarinales bacterium]